MNKKFPSYYRPSKEEKITLFKDNQCFFFFDTNALLDLYRIGKDTTDNVLSLIEKYKERIRIPFHVAEEYHNKMLKVIVEYSVYYRNILDKRDDKSLMNELYSKLGIEKFPALKTKIRDNFSKVLDDFYNNIEIEKTYLEDQIDSWELQKKISASLGTQLLDGFTEKELNQILIEGQERYKKHIPPGYKDDDNTGNPCGDYIIWREILRFAKENKCSIMFISRDLKEDWIYKPNGVNCGPCYELIEEFKKYSSGTFLLCTLDKFLEYANETQKVLQQRELERIAISLQSLPDSEETIKNTSDRDKAYIINKLSEQIGKNKISIVKDVGTVETSTSEKREDRNPPS